jgi:hypothetical protein
MDFENEVLDTAAPAEVPAPENFLLGLIGALVGAILGGASIILLSQIGYIASISGFILAICTLKGYELLGKRLSGKGIALCILLMIVTPFLADWIDWAIYLMRDYPEYELTIVDACIAMAGLMAEGYVDMAEYLKNLGMIYLFVVLGAFGTLKNVLKK